MADTESKEVEKVEKERDVKGLELSSLFTDPEKENTGVWVKYASGFEVKIARLNSKKYKEFMLRIGKDRARSFENKTMDPDEADNIMREAIAETILLDWRNMYDNGKPVPFSKELALEIMKKSYDFYKELFHLCQERELFLKDNEEAAGKN